MTALLIALAKLALSAAIALVGILRLVSGAFDRGRRFQLNRDRQANAKRRARPWADEFD